MSELTHLNTTLTLPGCTLHKCGLAISPAIDAEQEKSVAVALNSISGSALWWWGDLLCHLGKRYGETYTKAAEESSYAPSTLATARWVCSRIQFSHRWEDLSYRHHYEALSECDGDALKACEWLNKARANKWSVSEMRKAIRQGNATVTKDTGRDGQSSAYDHVKGLKLWLRTSMEAATPELRAELKRELLEIVEKL